VEIQQVLFRGGGPCGKLSLTNPSQTPRTVTLRVNLVSATRHHCRLWIEGPLWCDQCTLTPAPITYTRTVVVPPGRHVVCFCCEGTPDPRSRPGQPLLYCAWDFRVMPGALP
jgi:hypothetical protein